MARALVFQLGESSLPFQMQKVDRTKLYGSKEVEVLDEQEHRCELATLADDGRTLVGKGGTALGWLDADGQWRQKSDLLPHDVDGDHLQPVASSFDAPIELFETTSADDYLSHNIRLVYRMTPELDESLQSVWEDLMKQLAQGAIFKFSYSYRGGLEADTAFLLANEDNQAMMVVGSPTHAAFVGIQAKALADDEESSLDEQDDLMDFDMI